MLPFYAFGKAGLLESVGGPWAVGAQKIRSEWDKGAGRRRGSPRPAHSQPLRHVHLDSSVLLSQAPGAHWAWTGRGEGASTPGAGLSEEVLEPAQGRIWVLGG